MEFYESGLKLPLYRPKIISFYLQKWWMPSLVLSVALLIGYLCDIGDSFVAVFMMIITVPLIFASWIGIFISAIVNMNKKRWFAGSFNMFIVLLLIGPSFPSCGSRLLTEFNTPYAPPPKGPQELPENIVVPADLVAEIPSQANEIKNIRGSDPIWAKYSKFYIERDKYSPRVTADVSAFIELKQQHPDILKRYFSTSPYWRMYKESDLRTIMVDRKFISEVGGWRDDMWGGYEFYRSHHEAPFAQSKTSICLTSNAIWNDAWGFSETLRPGQTRRINTFLFVYKSATSNCIVKGDDFAINISEISERKNRPLTHAAMQIMADEFGQLAEAPRWETIQQMLPSDTIRHGEQNFDLKEGGYTDQWLNPGEPGLIYFRTYEVTTGQRLSAKELFEDTNRWVGWSGDPGELFYSGSELKILEEQMAIAKGKTFAARVEIWFVPDSGAPERKLIGKIYKFGKDT